jgi:hypothetical protein
MLRKSNEHAARLWDADVAIRWAVQADAAAIARLAELEERPRPAGRMLVAQARGEVVAALPVDGGEALADPFRPSADTLELLAFRARQLRMPAEARSWTRGLGRIAPRLRRARRLV